MSDYDDDFDELDDEIDADFDDDDDGHFGHDDYDDLDDDEDDHDDDDHDEDDDDDFDDIDDATDGDIDFVVAAYREDGAPVALALETDMANDLDEMIDHLRRLPGDAGALALLSLLGDVFVIVRVRGQRVQVFSSDITAGYDWPICRDILDYLGVEDIPDLDDDDDVEVVGDSEILRDLGVGDFDLEALAENYDISSDEALLTIADRIGLGRAIRETVDAEFGD